MIGIDAERRAQLFSEQSQAERMVSAHGDRASTAVPNEVEEAGVGKASSKVGDEPERSARSLHPSKSIEPVAQPLEQPLIVDADGSSRPLSRDGNELIHHRVRL